MIRKLIATCLYVGYAPIASGTFGSLAAVAIGLVLLYLLGSVAAGLVLLGLAGVLLFVGAPVGTWAESYYASKDPAPFVLDEVVGCFVALAPMLLIFPGAWQRPNAWEGLLPLVGLPFLFFRVFDVIKPPPAGRLEAIPGGWGIMLDDVVSALYAAAASVAGMLLFFN